MRQILAILLLISAISAEKLSLKSAENRALESGYTMRMNSADNKARSWQKRNVIAGYLPDVSYNATLMRVDDTTALYTAYQSGDPANPKPKMLNHEIAVSQPITNGGAEIVAIQMAKHTKEAQELGYKADSTDLILLVRQNYFELIKAKEQIKIAKQDLEWAEKNLVDAEVRKLSGVLPETDFLRWQRVVIDKNAFLLQSQALNEYREAELRVAMGENPDGANSIETDSFQLFEEYYNKFDLDSGVIDSNTRLQSLSGYREISHDQRKMAVTSAMPKLNGFYSWGKDQQWNNGNQVTTTHGKWSVGVGLNVPLFSGFRNSTSYFEKKYDAIKSDIEFEKTRNEMSANLIRIKKFMEASQIGAESSKKQFELNRKNFEIMNDRYSLGQINQIDLLEMNQALAGSRLDYITRTLETLYYYSEYQNAIGKLEVIQ